jgi:hypothetical protein
MKRNHLRPICAYGSFLRLAHILSAPSPTLDTGMLQNTFSCRRIRAVLELTGLDYLESGDMTRLKDGSTHARLSRSKPA